MRKGIVWYLIYSIKLSLAFILTGCLGPIYQKVDKIPENKGLIYIYRPTTRPGPLQSGPWAYDVNIGKIIRDTSCPNPVNPDGPPHPCKVTSGEIVITTFVDSYYPFVRDPGEVEVWAGAASTKINVKPGESYYIRLSVYDVYFLLLSPINYKPYLWILPPDIAEEEIAKCKLIPQRYVTNYVE